MSEEEKPINVRIALIWSLTVIGVFTITMLIGILVVTGDTPDFSILKEIIDGIRNA